MNPKFIVPFTVEKPGDPKDMSMPVQFPNMAQPIPPEVLAMMQRREEECFQDEREVRKKLGLEVGKAEIREKYNEKRRKERELERISREKSYNEITINDFGEVVSRVVHPDIADQDRRISNMMYPQIILLRRISIPEEVHFLMQFQIGLDEKRIFLDGKKIGRKEYLSAKLIAQGVLFYLKDSRVESYTRSLWGILSAEPKDVKWIPENVGWVEIPKEGIKFIGEGELTWKKLLTLIA